MTYIKIEEGDRVYWKIFAGMFPRTISGVVQLVQGEDLTIMQTTQNSHGKIVNRKKNHVTKNLKQ